MTLTQPFDLSYWLITTFSGTEEIFAMVALIAITFLCAKMRLPFVAFIGILILFASVMGAVYSMEAIIFIIIIVGGILLYSIIHRLMP